MLIFSQDDMNLTEELKAPLRKKSTKEKRDLLQMQFKGTIRVTAYFVKTSMSLCLVNLVQAVEENLSNVLMEALNLQPVLLCESDSVLFWPSFNFLDTTCCQLEGFA